MAAGRLDGYIAIELAAYLSGTAGVVVEVAQQCAERSAQACVVDPHSNASNLIKPLREAGMTVVTPSTADVQAAHGGFVDLVRAGGLRHVSHPQLDAAIREATERRLGGAAAWERRNPAADMAPAQAADLAVWGLGNLPPPPVEPWVSWDADEARKPPAGFTVGAAPGTTRQTLAPPPAPTWGLPGAKRA